MNSKLAAVAAFMAFALLVSAGAACAPLPVNNPNLENKDSCWVVIEDGRSGVVDENLNVYALGLENSTEYALIYYPDPWGTPIITLGTESTDPFGMLNIHGDPAKLVLNPADTNLPAGYKLWIVPTSDLNAEMTAFTAWNPEDYLFETALFPVPEEDEPKTPRSTSGSATMAVRITMDGGEPVELPGVTENDILRLYVTHGSILNDVQTLYYQEKDNEPSYDKDGNRIYSMRTAGELRYSVSGMQAFEIMRPNRLIRVQITHRNWPSYDGLPTQASLVNLGTRETLWSTVLEESRGNWAFVLV